MTSEERTRVIEELDRVKIVDNYPAILKDDTNVKNNMVLYISDTDFVSNVLVLRRHFRTMYRNFKRLSNATLFSNLFNPLASEVQFIPGDSLIFIPLPVVHNHLITSSMEPQNFETFASLGFLIGQALLRPLRLPQLKNLLTNQDNEDIRAFEDFLYVDAPIISYNGTGLHLRGATNLSIHSRIEDEASLRLSWDSYLKYMTGRQDLPYSQEDKTIQKTFFLTVAQQFCLPMQRKKHEMAVDLITQEYLPNHLRVNSMMMNSVKFTETFSCAVGSVMNPVLKNQQFPFIDENVFGGFN